MSLAVLTGCSSESNRFGIVFVSDNGVVDATDVYRMPDNTQNKIEQLTFTPTIGEYQLLVSKNADEIIFEAGPTRSEAEPYESAIEQIRHIYLLDTFDKKLEDITDIFTLPPTITPMRVADWSPDRKQFAFITYETGLGVMNFDGTNKKDISIPSFGEIPDLKVIKWSPDGKKLALIHGYAPTTLQHIGWALLIYDLGSGEIRQLADYEANCTHVEWSPASQQVVATCSYILPYTEIPEPDTVRIFSTGYSDQPYERLALSPCRHPSWSPDGKQIVFACEKGTNQMGLFIINSDGNGIHELNLENLGSPSVVRYPTWSPDGTQIIYVAGTDSGHTKIYSVNLDGTNIHTLTSQEAFYTIIAVYPVP